MKYANEELIALLKSPGDLQPLNRVSDTELQSSTGKKFPVIDGVICLLKEDERGKDLGDSKFYEEKPFGLRDWSNPEEVETGVENDMKQILKDMPKDAKIADIGAGTGRISNYLSMKGFTNVVSVDYSLASIKMVKKNSNNLCIWGNILSLPLESNSFDFVICTGVIHHTPDPELAFSECARIIKPTGRFYLKLRNIHSPYGYLFKTYGTVLRFFEARKSLRFLSDLLGFKVYKLTRKVFYSHLPKREDKVLRGKYENLFIKDLITFFNTRQVKQMLRENNLEILYGRKVGFTHRQHFYVAGKR
jgi:ubiquinone/menaquinone biosynthesis C-methylase UbiE